MKPDPWKRYRPKDERLRLALLKEKKAYRDFWTEHGGDKIQEAQKEIQAFYASLPHVRTKGLTPEDFAAFQKTCEGALDSLDKFNSGLSHFGIQPFQGPETERFVYLIDPFSKEPLPDPLPFAVF